MYSESSVGEDPRAPIWFTYLEGSTLANSGRFTGVANGYDIAPPNSKDNATLNLEGGYIGFVGGGASNANRFMPVLLYPEVVFLQAEGALRGWGGDANSLFKQGIQASMDFVGVDPEIATTYIDGVTDLSGSNEAQLKQLITQKYIANFPNGVEAWADFRRTDYPDITLPIDGVSGSASVESGTWVKRIRYPDSQHTTGGGVFMPASQNTIPTDRMDIRLWFDTADTKTKSGGLMSSNF